MLKKSFLWVLCLLIISFASLINSCALIWTDEKVKGDTTPPEGPSKFFFKPTVGLQRDDLSIYNTVLGTFWKDDTCGGIGDFSYDLSSTSSNRDKFMFKSGSPGKLYFNNNLYNIPAATTYTIYVEATDMKGISYESYGRTTKPLKFDITVP
ncbi:MAG: hypothetical protein Ta2G_01730 [Termitinemataceae bacterium]|nr:MAG: hypothetical protein Ta2G_01730 [Termitinemataceae bacterium]